MLLFNKNLSNKMILSTNQSILTTVQDPEQVLIRGAGAVRGVNGDSPPQKNMAPGRAAGGAQPSGSALELFY